MDTKDYWMKVREVEGRLDPSTFVVMLAIPSRGITKEVISVTDPLSAAQLMVNGTHRLATNEEVAAYHKTESELIAKNEEVERKKNMKHQIIVNNTIDEALLGKLSADKKKKGE
jgi:hypothetical protein